MTSQNPLWNLKSAGLWPPHRQFPEARFWGTREMPNFRIYSCIGQPHKRRKQLEDDDADTTYSIRGSTKDCWEARRNDRVTLLGLRSAAFAGFRALTRGSVTIRI